MSKSYFAQAASNFIATILLLTLIIAPFYFAKNIAQVAGSKTESKYLLVSQVEKFPGMVFSQNENNYTLTYTKQAEKQAFLSVLIINNPTEVTKNYQLHNSSQSTKFFFGEKLNDLQNTVTLPPQSSVPISLISNGQQDKDSSTFTINVN